MLDRLTVRQIALLLGHKEAYEWIRDHSSEYAEGVFRGFEAEVEEGDIPT
jgi:hypothetical protein